MNRRHMLTALVGTAAAGPLVPLASSALARPDEVASIITEAGSDPLHVLVSAYRDGLALYNASGNLTDAEDAALAARTWKPSYDILCTDPPAATSLAGAVEAIRVVAFEEERGTGQEEFNARVLRAALVYFDRVTA